MSEIATDLEIFDRAVYAYLATVTPRIQYSITSQALKDVTTKSTYMDDIPFSLISYHREPNFEIDFSRYNFSGAVFGDFVRLRETEGSREARYVKNIPVNLSYQIDLWAAKETVVQKLAIDLISKIHMQDQIVIAPMNPDGESARFHITLNSWVDNSDLEVENEKGRLYRHTINITIDSRIKLTEDISTTPFCEIPVELY